MVNAKHIWEQPMTANDKRNLTPHKAARFAMLHWHDRYASQNGGSMDFWYSLTSRERLYCREAILEIEASSDETQTELKASNP
jgi:hypothetical protein